MSETRSPIPEFSDLVLRAADALRSSDPQIQARAMLDLISFEREYDGLLIDHYDKSIT
jgi:hypothetical protein